MRRRVISITLLRTLWNRDGMGLAESAVVVLVGRTREGASLWVVDTLIPDPPVDVRR